MSSRVPPRQDQGTSGNEKQKGAKERLAAARSEGKSEQANERVHARSYVHAMQEGEGERKEERE